ncbi:hypothetical protein VTN96DRAFT_4199 [Rasamsonia emersonii]
MCACRTCLADTALRDDERPQQQPTALLATTAYKKRHTRPRVAGGQCRLRVNDERQQRAPESSQLSSSSSY